MCSRICIEILASAPFCSSLYSQISDEAEAEMNLLQTYNVNLCLYVSSVWLNKVKSKWPAIIIAFNRTAKVQGRIILLSQEASRGAEAQSVTVKRLVVGSIEWGLEEMKYLIKFIFPFFRSDVEAKRGDDIFAIQYAMPPEFRRKRSVLTLGFLCLPCCVQRKAGF